VTEKIIIAGSGGQGIMLLGKVLAEAAMREKKNVTFLPAYGAEVRGGTAYCMVIISDEEIGSTYIEKADCLIAMNAPSLERFKGRLKGNGLLVINSSMAPRHAAAKLAVLHQPFTDTAFSLGNIKVANMVALGSFLKNKKIVSNRTVFEVFEAMAPQGKKELIEVNIKALEEGARLND
jgi:2-oxoglutarate ferredoxin oxidoreductase subunit gamma